MSGLPEQLGGSESDSPPAAAKTDSSFFIRRDAWGIRIHRPNERGCHWMGRRSDCFGRSAASVPLSADDPPVDMTFGLRAVLGQNALGESACVASTPLG